MPKEVVYDHSTQYHSLTVGWNSDPGGVGITAQMCADAGEGMAKAGPAVDVHLDRAGINRLIRLLRKARDAAFGADA